MGMLNKDVMHAHFGYLKMKLNSVYGRWEWYHHVLIHKDYLNQIRMNRVGLDEFSFRRKIRIWGGKLVLFYVLSLLRLTLDTHLKSNTKKCSMFRMESESKILRQSCTIRSQRLTAQRQECNDHSKKIKIELENLVNGVSSLKTLLREILSPYSCNLGTGKHILG